MRGYDDQVAGPRADEIRWDLAPAPWQSPVWLLTAVVETLPGLRDAVAADLIEQLAVLVTNLDEQVNSMRDVRSEALRMAHDQHLEVDRLRSQLIKLR